MAAILVFVAEMCNCYTPAKGDTPAQMNLFTVIPWAILITIIRYSSQRIFEVCITRTLVGDKKIALLCY